MSQTSHQIQASTLPPAQPSYILRGHPAQVHALKFLRGNTRLLSGDAEGWVILWDVSTKRAVAVWRAHGKAILGLDSCGEGARVVSHGRDNSLKIWQLRQSDENTFSRILPVEDSIIHRKEPWLLHSLDVNTLNFCAFSMCYERNLEPSHIQSPETNQDSKSTLIAVPGLQEGVVNIVHLPSEERFHTVPPAEDVLSGGGMTMALNIFYRNEDLNLLTGHESGHVVLQVRSSQEKKWNIIFISRPHTLPLLSLDISSKIGSWYSSGADATIAIGDLPSISPSSKSKISAETLEVKKTQTKHSGQQSLTVRSDSRIFATAGWDSRVRVYSCKSGREVACLKWHKEGCYAVAFAEILDDRAAEGEENHGKSDGSEVMIEKEGKEGGKIARTVRQRREDKARETHWLASGSKDGKISLWEIY